MPRRGAVRQKLPAGIVPRIARGGQGEIGFGHRPGAGERPAYDRGMSRRARLEASWPPPSEPPPVCGLCGHEYERRELTKHHLVPKSRGGRETELICRPCHAQIHAVYTEKELEREFDSLEALRAAPKLASWMRFIRKRKPTGKIRVKTSRSKGR